MYTKSMNAQVFKIQQQIAVTLITKLEQHEITWERAGEIARQVKTYLPPTISDQQVQDIISRITGIPELSQIGIS